MVGLKTIWLLITLLVLASCVPQTKQTDCGSNEAFSPSLRACIPISQDAASFINISSYIPTAPLTKYKNDTSNVTLSIVISNPYTEPYTVTWERVYAGNTVALSATTSTSYTFVPFSLQTEVGTHTFVVKIKSSSGKILDSHNFEVHISDNPKPVIVSSTVTPAMYANTYNPTELPQDFSFTVNNNNASSMSSAGYRVDWTLFRSGLIIDTESDTFPTSSPIGSLSATGSNYPVYTFDPAALYPVGSNITGSYVVRARLTNTAAEVVAEQQWSVTVDHPALPKITARDIYAASTSPAFSTITKAFDGVAYTAATAYNFIPCTMSSGICVPISGATAQADYCVTVADGHGSYTTDSYYVRVTYYLDGNTSVYTGLTSAVDNKVCLSDGGSSVLSSVLFANTNSMTAQNHTLVARVVDDATGREYTLSDMNGSLGTYPLTWNLSVQPQNQKPSVSFGALTTASCTSSVGNSMSGCGVASDTNFTVKINLDADDFYTPITGATQESKFNYSIRLYRNNVLVHTCTKSQAGMDGSIDSNGTDGYSCNLRINSYDGAGPVDVTTSTYQVQAEILDVGSPIAAAPATSSTLTWTFAAGSVTETNTAPSIASFSVSGSVDEGNPLSFSASVTDAERDNFSWVIEYCKNTTCASNSDFVSLSSGNVVRTNNSNPYAWTATYNTTQDFLLTSQLPSCTTTARDAVCNKQFRLRITDTPSSSSTATQSATSSTASSNIKNINPVPVLTLTSLTPNPITYTSAVSFTGFPVSLNASAPSFINDSSTVAAEKNFRFQWYARNNASVTTYQPIDGANTFNLIWTPSLIKAANLSTDNPVLLMLCVEDQPATVVATPNPTNSICTAGNNAASWAALYVNPWSVTVRNNTVVAYDISTGSTTTELSTTSTGSGTETAVWYELPTTTNSVVSSAAYIASIGNDKRIYVKKVLVRDNGQIDTIDSSLRIEFDAVPTGTILEVKDLSITGYQPNAALPATELYIAYMASRTGTPGSFYPQVRRIDLTHTPGKSGTSNNQAGKFGFDYDGPGFNNNCSTPAECTVTTSAGSATSATSGVLTISFSPTAALTGNFEIVGPLGTFQITFGTYNGTNQICSNCSGAQMATDLSNILSQSADFKLAGYSATPAGNTVTINGSLSGDYFDSSLAPFGHISDQVGQIYISGTNWYLPFINSSLGGADNDKLSVYTAPVSGMLNPASVTTMLPSTTSGLNTIPASSKFSSYFDGTNLTVGVISKVGSYSYIYRMNPTTMVINSLKQIMLSDVGLDIQVAGNSSNVFAMVKVSAGSDLKVGAYNETLTAGSEFSISDPAYVEATSDTDDYFNAGDLASWKIIPYGTEARIIGASKGLGSTYDLYMARLKVQSSSWVLSCGDCDKISPLGNNISPYVKVSAAPIRMKASGAGAAAYRLATDGSISNQGIKDVMFLSYGHINSGSSCDPALGVMNVEVEGISSANVHVGSGSNQDSGLYRSPIVK